MDIPISLGLFAVIQVVSAKANPRVHSREFTSGSGFSALTIYPALRGGCGLRESGLPQVRVRPRTVGFNLR